MCCALLAASGRKGASGEDQQTTPSLGNILLQSEEPSWGQGKLHYKTVWELIKLS